MAVGRKAVYEIDPCIHLGMKMIIIVAFHSQDPKNRQQYSSICQLNAPSTEYQPIIPQFSSLVERTLG